MASPTYVKTTITVNCLLACIMCCNILQILKCHLSNVIAFMKFYMGFILPLILTKHEHKWTVNLILLSFVYCFFTNVK